MTPEQIDAVARRVVERLRAEAAAAEAARATALRTAVWGLLAQLDSAAIELRAVGEHARHVRGVVD
ncbi:MAG: hypothetical protein Q8L23_15800 [Caulobacter sp.]|nr:hypothetical protein [Caulobacter sp.]